MTSKALGSVRFLFSGVLLLGVLVSGSSVQAATYYCDPVAGDSKNDGSATSPWPKLEDVVQSGKMAQLKGGDTLLLRSGNHGNIRISGDNAETVTIAAASGEKPQLGRLEVVRGSKWLLKGLTISPAFSPAPYPGDIVVLAERGPGSDIVLQDCFVYTAADSSKWTKDDWMHASNGIFVGRNGTRMTLRNNYVLNTRFAISAGAPDSLFEGNVVDNFSGDGLRVMRDDITVRYNAIRNSFLGSAEGDANHDDLIQCFLFAKGTGTVRRATIEDNILIGNEDPKQPFLSDPQGIGCFDGPLLDFDVERNIIRTNIYHGIALYDAVNCKILDNVVKARSVQKAMPWIALGTKNKGGSTGNVVKNNMAHAFLFKDSPDVVAENNVPVDDAVFSKRLREEEQLINDKFGKIHPIANLPRFAADPKEQ